MSSLVEAGTALLRAGHFAAAERLLYRAAQGSDDAHAWQLVGAARHKLGKRAGAREAWAKALALDPALSDAACALATVLADEERWSDAEAVLRSVLKAHPAETQVHFNLAVLLERRGAGDEALEHYDAALAEAHHTGALLNRGALKMRLGRPGEALADFERIVCDDHALPTRMSTGIVPCSSCSRTRRHWKPRRRRSTSRPGGATPDSARPSPSLRWVVWKWRSEKCPASQAGMPERPT